MGVAKRGDAEVGARHASPLQPPLLPCILPFRHFLVHKGIDTVIMKGYTGYSRKRGAPRAIRPGTTFN